MIVCHVGKRIVIGTENEPETETKTEIDTGNMMRTRIETGTENDIAIETENVTEVMLTTRAESTNVDRVASAGISGVSLATIRVTSASQMMSASPLQPHR